MMLQIRGSSKKTTPTCGKRLRVPHHHAHSGGLGLGLTEEAHGDFHGIEPWNMVKHGDLWWNITWNVVIDLSIWVWLTIQNEDLILKKGDVTIKNRWFRQQRFDYFTIKHGDLRWFNH